MADVVDKLAKPPSILGVRHAQAFLLFLALAISFGMRVNMSIAIVAMTDTDNPNYLDWSTQIQSVILSSFFWGYVVLQIPAGELAAKFGGKILVTSVVAINSAITFFIPFAAYYGGWKLVCACRAAQGLSQGFLFPSMHTLIGQWVPLEEKSRLGTIIYAGVQLGTAIQLMTAGFIAEYWGWPAIFYVNGAVGAIWTAVYAFVGSSSPQSSGLISAEERLYIQTSLGQIGGKKKMQTPWTKLFTSMPFIALIIVNWGQTWGFYTLLTEIPSYMKQVLGVDIAANGVMSAVPYLTMYLVSFPFGFMSDYVLAKNWISITAARKISNSIGLVGPAIALIVLSYAPADATIAVVLLSAVVGLNAGHYTGFLLVHIDMAPNFAGTMLGITNGTSNFMSIIAPLVAGVILKDPTSAHDWRNVFYLSSVVYFVTNLIFVIFGTSERQSWNEPDSDDKMNNIDVTKGEKLGKVV